MATKETIQQDLVKSNAPNLPDYFAAAAVYINEKGYLHHAGIAVGSKAGKSLFHYYDELLIDELEKCDNYIQRDFINIPPYLADAFYVHCNEATKHSAPDYGFFYNGTYFKDGKILVKEESDPYRMSCVGYCLGILKGWDTDTEDYIYYQDWNANNTLRQQDIKSELEELIELYPKLSKEELEDGIRRIKPSEYLASAYISEKPVRKADTDPIANILKAIGEELRPAAA